MGVGELPELFLFVPQLRLSMESLVDRALAAEQAGFAGIAFMDHLVPPAAIGQPMFEAMTTATWVAARTDRLTVSHLVLCDALRHPAVLAQAAVTLQQASGGRFELGLGWGSVPEELVSFGVTDAGGRQRLARLADSLELITGLWSGEPVTLNSESFAVEAAQLLPVPTPTIPILVGGAGPGTLALVRRYATWANFHVNHLDRLDDLVTQTGSARVSIQRAVAYVAERAQRDEVTAVVQRRFGAMSTPPLIADGDELRAELVSLRARGVERVYVWLTDGASPRTVDAIGRQVLS